MGTFNQQLDTEQHKNYILGGNTRKLQTGIK